MQLVDDDGEGTVASYVAGGAERVHCDVEGNHQCLCFWVDNELEDEF